MDQNHLSLMIPRLCLHSLFSNIWDLEDCTVFINTHIQVFWATCFAAVSLCSFSHFSCSIFRFTLYSLRSVNSCSHLARAWVKAASTYKQIKKKSYFSCHQQIHLYYYFHVAVKEQTSVWIAYVYRN